LGRLIQKPKEIIHVGVRLDRVHAFKYKFWPLFSRCSLEPFRPRIGIRNYSELCKNMVKRVLNTRKEFSLIFSALEVWHARLKTSPRVLFTAIYVYMRKRELPYLMLRPNELANQTKVWEARIYLSFSSFRSCADLCAWKIIKRQCKDIDETTFEFFPRLFLMLKVSSINYLFFFRKWKSFRLAWPKAGRREKRNELAYRTNKVLLLHRPFLWKIFDPNDYQ
jgi:hypothetical protein